MRWLIFCGWWLSTLASCSPKILYRPATSEDLQLQPATAETSPLKAGCFDPLAYVEHPEIIRMKYVRLNFHFMNSTDGQYNMQEKDMEQFARDWVYVANQNLSRNQQMFLPHGNSTPVLPIPYRYVITPDPQVPGDKGVYQHIDDELCYAVKTGRERNISDKRMITKYAVHDDSILNVFVLTHQLDSIKSKTYKPDGSGISLGSSVKVFGQWFKKPSPWDYRGIFNHEIGHSLGLSHTWGGHDGCDDTPPHPNCYNKSDKPPCDSLYSNNMMDYNLHSIALTPCQIGKVLMNMNNIGSLQRNLVEPRWCHLDTSGNITIADSVRWRGSADLEGNLIIENGGHLEIGCRISMPPGATITIKRGGSLTVLPTGWIHNACGRQWNGIVMETLKKEKGKIIVMEGGRLEDSPLVTKSKS